MTKNKYETQFSIYKVDYICSIKYFEEEKNIKIQSYDDLEKNILEDICTSIKKKYNNEIVDISLKDYKGIVFKTHHYPSWYGIMTNIIQDKIDLSNTHVSYVLSYLNNNNLFLLTGGLGSNYISEYTYKNYGLYLLPKIMHENSPTIKTVLENKMSGNKISSKHSNRNVTTINTENDMSSIFRELSLEINEEIADLLKIPNDKNKKINNVNLIAKDSFVIRKSVNIEQLTNILDKLISIEKETDNFSLGYFIDAKKRGYSSQYLNDIFVTYLLERKTENFVLVGDEYSDYCVGGNKYIIKDQDNEIIHESDSPITISDIFEKFFLETISKNSIEKMLKYTLTVYNDKEIILFPTQIKKCIQGHIEDEMNTPFFLFNGNWIMFDSNYLDNLDEEYKKNYKQMTNIDSNLIDIILNKNNSLTEDSYNKKFSTSNEIIVAHTVLSNNIELADLIYYDEDSLYLVHNKYKFQGNSARDVLNQILTSAEFINHYLMEKNEFFERYYDDIIKKYPNNKKIKSLTKADFVSLFSKPNVYYVAGFMENLSDNTESNYAKYVILNASKKLIERGYNLLLFNINQ